MFVRAYANGFVVKDYHTETAGTTIDEEIPGRDGYRLALVSLNYLAAATAHTLSVLHCGSLAGSRTTSSAAAAAAQKVLNVTDAPTDPAGNATASGDIIAYQVETGAWEFNTVASLSTKAITLTTNIAVAVSSGAKVRIFGVVGDGYCFNVHLTASVVTSFDNTLLALAPYRGDPLYTTVTNATNAGFQNNMVFAYINK